MTPVWPNCRAPAGGSAYGRLDNGTAEDPGHPRVTTACCAGSGGCPSIRNWDIAVSEIHYLHLGSPIYYQNYGALRSGEAAGAGRTFVSFWIEKLGDDSDDRATYENIRTVMTAADGMSGKVFNER
jgi:hypothetical protein